MGKSSRNQDKQSRGIPRLGYDMVARPDFRTEASAALPETRTLARSRKRIGLAIGLFSLGFAVIGGKLVMLGAGSMSAPIKVAAAVVRADEDSGRLTRPNVVDRNGEVMAIDIMTASLYADIKDIPNREEAIRGLRRVLPDLNEKTLRRRLSKAGGNIRLMRELTPRQEYAVHNLGLPGINFEKEFKRVYPNGTMASHVLGYVNADNEGVAGIEYHIDHGQLLEQDEVAVSVDMRIQHVLRDELSQAMATFSAKAAVGVVMDVTTGEVIGMSSLPDFDPNDPMTSKPNARFSRATLGVYEMGSTFKAFSVAAALDSGLVRLSDRFDARKPLKVAGGFTIRDFHAQKRELSVSEVFMHSSNIGTAKMVMELGRVKHRSFLDSLGLLGRPDIELPERGTPLLPVRWTDLSTMTISYGHGLSVTPLQVVAAGAAIVNGGFKVSPTFVRQDGDMKARKRVLSAATSKSMRKLMRLVVAEGTGRRADVLGYPVLGKTGTAEKAMRGGYSRKALLTSFLSAFPADNPRYAMLVMLDEPQGIKATYNFATAGWNAAPLTGRIVRRIAPMLGLKPEGRWQSPVQSVSFTQR
ncbi:MAG: penicillin-binding protein 2 [Parvibaculaceae bacterium]|nr:penicillin-binding protein 2 [Parvibaculaceae bacterium]